MTRRKRLAKAEKVKLLAERLSRCPQVSRCDEGENIEAWTLAHAFADIEESFSRFLDEQLPRLTEEELSEGTVNEALLEIGEEFRHVLYHLSGSRFYRYLDPADIQPRTVRSPLACQNTGVP